MITKGEVMHIFQFVIVLISVSLIKDPLQNFILEVSGVENTFLLGIALLVIIAIAWDAEKVL